MPRVQRIQPLQEAVAELVELLKNGTFKVGDLLPSERQLAERLKVSRMVVREATKKLEQRGIVRVRQGIGVRVIDQPSLPLQDAFAMYLDNPRERLIQSVETRLVIEPELAARAALDPRAENLRELEEIHASLVRAMDTGAAVRLDIAFHEKIAVMAGNQLLALILASLAELGRKSREQTIANVGPERAIKGHGKILAAIKAGDSARARRTMFAHIKDIFQDLC